MFFIENAKEIMFLCLGGGFLILIIYIVRSLVILTRLLNKVDDITDLVVEYIQKPLSVIIQAHRTFQKVQSWFKK